MKIHGGFVLILIVPTQQVIGKPTSDLCINFFFFLWLRWFFVATQGFFSSCGERGLLFVAVRRLLTAVASLVAEHEL